MGLTLPQLSTVRVNLRLEESYSLIFVLWMHERVSVDLCKALLAAISTSVIIPDVLVIKKRAFVLFANSSMFIVPINDVLTVLIESNW